MSAQTKGSYSNVFTTIPKQPTEKKPGQLTQEQVKQFFEEGYVVVEEFFKPEELEACREDIKSTVEELAQKLYKAGKIKDLYQDHGFFQRLAKMDKDFPGAHILHLKMARFPKSFQHLWSNDRILNLNEQLLGTSDIVGHPVWNLRPKLPNDEETIVPWHQDSSYMDENSYDVMQTTAWIPLLDANETNGCMQMVKGGHRPAKVAKHTCCWAGTWYTELDEKEMEKSLGVNMAEDLVTCPVPYGGMVLINNMIPHRSLSNTSNDIRWSMDLRWQRADKPPGFSGKDGIRLRSSTDPNLVIDWDSYLNVNKRHTEHGRKFHLVKDEFDTTIVGEWMLKWEITNTNRHTDRFFKDKKAATEK